MSELVNSSSPHVNWDSPAGRVLKRLIAQLPDDEQIRITVFGSAPLQLRLDNSFLSADVDVFSDYDLEVAIARAGLGKGECEIYIHPCDEIVFSAAPSWRDRALTLQLGNVFLTIPDPIDILVSKIKRLEPKDLDAFRMVLEVTGHPTSDELKMALHRHVDLFRPNFDEERGGDAIANTRALWKELYRADIDVRAEIIRPALEIRRKAYGGDVGGLKLEIPGE